jgi:tetratricopeptide (TPR) repeat protein
MPRPTNIPNRKSPIPPKLASQQKRVAPLIQQGLAFHQAGKFSQAQELYERALAIQKYHFDALQLLGALFIQTQQFTKAIEFLTLASKTNPNHAACFYNCGVAFQELRRLDEAVASYDNAIRINAHYVEAHFNRGNALKELKRLDEALGSYDTAISIQPDNAEAYSNRGIVLQELKRFDEALISYDKAIRLKPDYAPAFYNRGNALKELKRLDEALQSYDKSIRLKPDYAVAYYNLGVALQELKRLNEALISYDKAISLKPDYAEGYSNRGNALKELKLLDDALVSYDKAISIQSDFAEAYYNRGVTLIELKRLDEAVVSFDKAIGIKPHFAEAYSNRGQALQELKRLDEALVSYDTAISIKPDYAEAYSNRGVALQELRALDEAVANYHKAICIEPNYAEANFNLSLCNLLRGNFKDGWQGYEWRWKNENIIKTSGVRNFLHPLWLGVEPLKDKTILLYAEQGLGDTIQFCRYVSYVAQLGAKVIVEVQRPLLRLLKNLEGASQVIAMGDQHPEFDFQCPLLSLPLAFKTELSSIPLASEHISSDIDHVTKWQDKLGKKAKLRVGVVWSGSTGHKNDHNRSLTLSKLLPHLPCDVEYVCLQKEIRDIDKELLKKHSEIQYFGEELVDFLDTAALCQLMDVVISVDTSVAHLSGTLGKPTWILLPFCPDWRWLLNKDESPWYPSVKLYRQEKINDWTGILEKIKNDLKQLIK